MATTLTDYTLLYRSVTVLNLTITDPWGLHTIMHIHLSTINQCTHSHHVS